MLQSFTLVNDNIRIARLPTGVHYGERHFFVPLPLGFTLGYKTGGNDRRSQLWNYKQEWADEVRAGVGDLSYSKAAAKIGCSKSYISEWMTSKVPSRELVVAYARGLGRDLNRALMAAGYQPEDSLEAMFSPAEHLFHGLIALEERFDVPILRGFHLQGGFAGLTLEEAESVLQSLDALLTERLGKPNVG